MNQSRDPYEDLQVHVDREGEEWVSEVAVRAANELGDHATGTVIVSLP